MNYYNQKLLQNIQNMQNNPQLQLQLQLNQQNPQLIQQQLQQQQLQQQQLQQQQLQQQQLQLQQLQLQQLQQQKLQQQKILQMQQYQQYINNGGGAAAVKLNPAIQFSNPATVLQANSVANSVAKTSTLQQLQHKPPLTQAQAALIQQQQAVAAASLNSQTAAAAAQNAQRKIFIQEIVRCLNISGQTDEKKLVEIAIKLEDQVFKKSSDSFEKYKALMHQQINHIKQKTAKPNIQQVQQQAAITTQHTTPQFQASIIANKVNGNPVLLQNNTTTAQVAALSKTINNASPSMNASKLASTSSSLQNVPQSVTVNNSKTTSPNNLAQNLQIQQKQNQNLTLQQKQTILQNQAHTTPQSKPTTTTANQQIQSTISPNEQDQKQDLKAKIESVYALSLKFKDIARYINVKDPEMKTKIENMVRVYKYAQLIYEKRNEQINITKEVLEKLEKNIQVFYDIFEKQHQANTAASAAAANSTVAASNSTTNNSLNSTSAQLQQQIRLQQARQAQNQPHTQLNGKIANNQTATQTPTQSSTLLNNTITVKTEPKVETVNKTPVNQPKTINIETIKTENKNIGLKTSNSEVFIPEDKSEIEKTSNKTSNSSSTKKRNSKKSNTSSSSISSINLTSKKTEISSTTELSSKRGANSSKDFKLEKDNSAFLGKIDRNINIFLLDNKNFKSHIKSSSKTRSIVQNSFKYIIDENRPAYGINSCAEEISSLCFSNENKSKDKPIRFENINDSPNDHKSLFEDIINRKSHIITNKNKNVNKKNLQQSIKTINENETSKRKFDGMNDIDDSNTITNINKKMKINDKYSNIIEEINFLKDKYKITVNIVDIPNITLILKDNKSCEIPWNEFISMINTIKKEESEIITSDSSNMNENNINSTSLSSNLTTNNSTHKINNERVMLIISLNLSNYIDTNEAENEYNIPGDNQSNIVIYARIPKSTQRYSHHGIFDWNLSYIKKKSIFQTSDEDNKLKEKKIYDFVSHKIHDQDTTNNNTISNTNTVLQDVTNNIANNDISKNTDISSSTSTPVIKVWHIVEWILEGVKS